MRVSVTAEARTGVEMEALSAVSAGLLTIYDMCKATDRAMEIASIRLLSKTGGASGEWEHPVATELLEDRRSGRSEDR